MQLRSYQEALIERARAQFRAGNRRVLMVAPCGAGKTVLAAYMCGEHVARGGNVLFLAHRSELLRQAAQTFERTGAAQITADRGAVIELGDSITVMSVQTAARRIARLSAPTMIIADECHHAAAKTWQTVLQAFPEAHVVGLTATPIRLDGRGLGDCFDTMVQEVDAEWLIANGYLAPYRYYGVPTLDTQGLHKKRGEYQAADIEALFAARGEHRIAGDVVAHYRRLADGQQAICYCPSVRLSQYYAERFREAGIAAEHMDGDMSADARQAAVERYRRRETTILCNVDLLGEGFDVPDCSCCIMLRPTASLSLYIQQAMRCMRYQPDKTAIIIDHVANYRQHGAPDEAREWTLQGRKGKTKESDVPVTRECPVCYAVLRGQPDICPVCGHKFERPPVDDEPPAEDDTAQLEEIRFKKRREEAQARSLEDFYRIAKERGYKPGWAWMRAKARGYV